MWETLKQIWEISKNTFLHRTPMVVASVQKIEKQKNDKNIAKLLFQGQQNSWINLIGFAIKKITPLTWKLT